MPKMGILQGRVIPEDLKRLQIFPASHWLQELREIERLGFDYVELLHDQEGECEKVLRSSGNDDPRRGTGKLQALSVCLHSLVDYSAMNKGAVFCAQIRRAIELFQGFDARVLILPFFEKNLVLTVKQARAVLNMMEAEGLLEEVKAAGAVFACELDLPGSQLAEIFEAFHHEAIGLCYDVGNARAAGRLPQEEILLLNEAIKIVHLKDRPVGGGNVLLGQGDVDFSACLQSLRDISYDGMMTLETCYERDPRQEAKRHLMFIKNEWDART
ncbi:MAG TPA: TIM barrel protein [Candidatus Bathyarchaeia archaeon]|nr:TIM barrel protein [Candidatus Bathyarchaeia archaeon]